MNLKFSEIELKICNGSKFQILLITTGATKQRSENEFHTFLDFRCLGFRTNPKSSTRVLIRQNNTNFDPLCGTLTIFAKLMQELLCSALSGTWYLDVVHKCFPYFSRILICVVDTDPVGSEIFCRIRILNKSFPRSGSGQSGSGMNLNEFLNKMHKKI